MMYARTGKYSCTSRLSSNTRYHAKWNISVYYILMCRLASEHWRHTARLLLTIIIRRDNHVWSDSIHGKCNAQRTTTENDAEFTNDLFICGKIEAREYLSFYRLTHTHTHTGHKVDTCPFHHRPLSAILMYPTLSFVVVVVVVVIVQQIHFTNGLWCCHLPHTTNAH